MRSGVVVMLVCLALVQAASAQPATSPARPRTGLTLPDLKTPEGTSGVLKWLILLTVLSVAPAIVVMMTCFTRIIVVLGLLRQALATNQLPPNQILFGLALLMTLVVMAPVYKDIHREAVEPYLDGRIDQAAAVAAGKKHVRTFMIRQIEAADNQADVEPFLDDALAARAELTWKDVPTTSLISAFVVSELKTAFWMGFRIYLPFVVIDLLVASVVMSVGMLMLPPTLISMPLKLLLFVLADGWHLVVGTLMQSFG